MTPGMLDFLAAIGFSMFIISFIGYAICFFYFLEKLQEDGPVNSNSIILVVCGVLLAILSSASLGLGAFGAGKEQRYAACLNTMQDQAYCDFTYHIVRGKNNESLSR
jgi:hypothetical protein